MGSHLWALSSPTFISLPATSLGRANLWHFTFTLSSPHLPWCQPSPATLVGTRDFAAPRKPGRDGHKEVLLPKKTGNPRISSLKELESTWKCEHSNLGLFLCSWRAPPASPKPFTLGASFALRSCPKCGQPHSRSRARPTQGIPRDTNARLAPLPFPAKLPGIQNPSQSRCGTGWTWPGRCWDSGAGVPSWSTCRAPGLLLHPAPSRLPSLCS